MSTLKVQDEKLIVEPEETHGDLDKMQAVLEKWIELYKRSLKEDTLNDLRLTYTRNQERMDDESPLNSNRKDGKQVKNLETSLYVYID